MNTKNKLILSLLLLGLTLFAIIQGVILPNMKQDEEQYVLDQQEPLTHHFEGSQPYKNMYMGNASNLIHLFNSLPLNNFDKTFQLYPEVFSVEVIYDERISDIGLEKVEKSVVYNATAAFVLIDNLEEVQFNFLDGDYQISRSEVSEGYEMSLEELEEVDVWEREVQAKFRDSDHVRNFLD